MYLAPLLMIATAFWGQTPACGQPSIERAQFQAPVVGLADIGTCTILVDPSRFQGAGWACQTVLHEFGHLIGLGHSSDPNNVMYPVIRTPIWPCKW